MYFMYLYAESTAGTKNFNIKVVNFFFGGGGGGGGLFHDK